MKGYNKKKKQKLSQPKGKPSMDGARKKKLKPLPRQKYKLFDLEEDK